MENHHASSCIYIRLVFAASGIGFIIKAVWNVPTRGIDKPANGALDKRV
jgi:hypothetical protein